MCPESFGGVRFDIILCMSRFNHVPSYTSINKFYNFIIFTPQPLRAVRVLFSPMVSGLAGRAGGKSLSGLYLRNRKV